VALQAHSLEQKACPSSTGRHDRISAATVFVARLHSTSVAQLAAV
jgi:hypothetical protein